MNYSVCIYWHWHPRHWRLWVQRGRNWGQDESWLTVRIGPMVMIVNKGAP